MFRPSRFRFAWNKLPRPASSYNPWSSFFRSNFRRTLINSSRDNRWPQSPVYDTKEGKKFNWDAFRWTNYRVSGTSLNFSTYGRPPVFTTLVSAIVFVAGTKTARLSEAWRNPLNNDWSTYPLRRHMALRYGGPKAWISALPLLRNIVGDENISLDEEELHQHGINEWSSYIPSDSARFEPHVIVYPETTQQISDIARVAHKYKLPIIPYSGGTSIEGHFSAVRGGICIDFSRMDKIIKVNEEDLDAIVQPGVGWEDLNAYLENKGLWFPPDPGPGAKIGGMVGTGCSGTNAGRYGTMRDWVINLTVVLADGTIIKTRQRPRLDKSSTCD